MSDKNASLEDIKSLRENPSAKGVYFPHTFEYLECSDKQV